MLGLIAALLALLLVVNFFGFTSSTFFSWKPSWAPVTAASTTTTPTLTGKGTPTQTAVKWAELTDACFKRENAFSSAHGVPGCYAKDTGKYICSATSFEATGKKCSDEANAAGRL